MPTNYGKETLTVFEIDMPFCQLEWGTTNAAGTCPATLGPEGETFGSPPVAFSGDHKCFQTRKTCPVPESYLPATQVIRFAQPQRGLKQYANIIPALSEGPDNPSTTPGIVNLGGMDRSLSALGAREAVDISLEDFQWNDHLFDKYRLERISGAAQADAVGYDPATRGTFWGKFLARNPYYAAYRARVKVGYMGDALEDLRTRHYIVDRITGPTNGKVKIALKDLFSLIEARKAVAPVASQGELAAGINASVTAATLSPAGIGNAEYPTSGYVAIGDEVAAFTRTADALTLTRGALGTTASTHDAEDLVQLVLELASDQAHEHIYTLLTGYAEIAVSEIDKAAWDILAASMPELYETFIVEPTPVKDLIGELCEQAGCTVWPDPETGMINFRPLRPSASSTTVNDRNWIVQNSLDIKRQDAKRVSKAIVYFARRNVAEDLDELRNYKQRVITGDADAESPTQYGVPAIRVIPSRWIPQFGTSQATGTGERVIALFRDPPLEASFRLHATRDGTLRLAEPFNLQCHETQDDTGAEASELMLPISIHANENEVTVKAQGGKFYTVPGDTGVREIPLNSADMRNLNLRTIHDSIYEAPVGGETVTFILPAGFVVGSVTTGSPAIASGSWLV